MVISIASGKGGTGKTTVAVNLALSIPGSVYLDADVEEPNGGLFLHPRVTKTEEAGRRFPRIDKNRCTGCGKCAKVCEYHALTVLPNEVLLFSEMCHSCGACSYFCPENAITEVERPVGKIRYGTIEPEKVGFIEGCLIVGEMMASPMIGEVKARIRPGKIHILDAPPGTACSMVEAVRDTDYCILVAEPTPFGLHDLKLTVRVLRIMRQPFGVVINKSSNRTPAVRRYCESENIPVLMEIPFDRRFAEVYSRGEPLVRVFPEVRELFNSLVRKIITVVRERVPGREASIVI